MITFMMNLHTWMHAHINGLHANGVTALVAAEASPQATPYHSYCDACMSSCASICQYICIYIDTYIFVGVCIHTYICISVYIYTDMYIRATTRPSTSSSLRHRSPAPQKLKRIVGGCLCKGHPMLDRERPRELECT